MTKEIFADVAGRQHHLPTSFVSIICQREIYSKSGSFTERAGD
jgi:hypothetical protein